MKKLNIAIALFLISVMFFSTTAEAKVNTKAITRGSFTELSTEDMEDTINYYVQKIAKDSGISHELYTSCYDWEESHILAYNTLCTYTICVNLSGFRTTVDADAANETVEYHLIKTLAHEVRHSYQWEHQNDDSDYGRACKQGFADYESYNGDKESYYQQFIEQDAEQYAIEYANKYFGK